MSATNRKNLRTGQSIWQARRLAPIESFELTRDLKADVAIVGAGISGAMAADALSESGLKVALFDRRGPLKGSTPASTALLQYEIDVPLCKLSERIGRERAERIWRRSRLALCALEERAKRLNVKADLFARDSLYLQGDELDAEGLRVEARARRRAGFEVVFLEPKEVRTRFGISGRAALLGFGNLCADPRRLAAGFLNAALRRGARIYAPATVDAIETHGGGVEARTKHGPVISARHLVFASGYELPKGAPLKGHKIESTFVIATKPQPRRLWPGGCLIWESASPYLYIREGPQGRIICGGEDEPFSDEAKRDALLPMKTAALEAKLARLLPNVDPRADFAWCGSFGGSETGAPSIGPLPKMPGCYAILGYGGNGITFSMMAAQMLRGMIAGDGDPDADLFSFTRKF